ncbi:MAG: DMT family transporter [Bacilli bacterium]
MRRFAPHLGLLAVILVWAGTFLVTKHWVAVMGPDRLAFWRNLLAAALLTAWSASRRQLLVSWRDQPVLMGMGLTGVALFYLLQHWGIQFTSVTDTALLISLAPVFVLIFLAAMRVESPRAHQWLGAALAMAGTAWLVDVQFQSRSWHQGAGDFAVVASAAVWAINTVSSRKILRRHNALTLVTWTHIWGALALGGWLASHRALTYWEVGLGRTSTWFALSYLAVLGSAVGYIAWYAGVARLGAATTGAYLYLRPIVTALLAWIILGQMPTSRAVEGGLLIIGGTWMSATQRFGSWSVLRKDRQPKSEVPPQAPANTPPDP